jgi:hypothetical protein
MPIEFNMASLHSVGPPVSDLLAFLCKRFDNSCPNVRITTVSVNVIQTVSLNGKEYIMDTSDKEGFRNINAPLKNNREYSYRYLELRYERMNAFHSIHCETLTLNM